MYPRPPAEFVWPHCLLIYFYILPQVTLHLALSFRSYGAEYNHLFSSLSLLITWKIQYNVIHSVGLNKFLNLKWPIWLHSIYSCGCLTMDIFAKQTLNEWMYIFGPQILRLFLRNNLSVKSYVSMLNILRTSLPNHIILKISFV